MANQPCLVYAEGECIDYTPAAAVGTGEVVMVGGMALIAPKAIAAGDKGILDHERAYRVPKKVGAMSFGDRVYWDPVGNPRTGTAGTGAATLAPTGYLLGVCIAPALSADDYVAMLQLGLQALAASGVTLGTGASTAALGVAAGDAAPLPAGTSTIYPTTGADGAKGVILNVADKVTGRTLIITNDTAAILKVYPPTGGTINGAAANAAFSSGAGADVTITCTSGTANTWTAR